MDNPLKGSDDYEFVRFCGKGGFGTVVEAVDKVTNERVAIKLLDRGPGFDSIHVRREVLNHRALLHHHVVRFIKLILTDRYLGIVMEFSDGGNLLEYIGERGFPLQSKLVRFLFQQLVIAVEYCHEMDVVNRDIKLQNTLLSGNKDWPMLKICDFGYSKHSVVDSYPNSIVGTRQAMAPEVIALQLGEEYDGKKADIWGMGIFLYIIAAGRYPFCDGRVTDDVLRRRIIDCEYQIPNYVSSNCADLIRKMLVRQPEARATMEEIKSHPYFLKNLPAGAMRMNMTFRRQRSVQRFDEIEWILLKAKERVMYEYAQMRRSNCHH